MKKGGLCEGSRKWLVCFLCRDERGSAQKKALLFLLQFQLNLKPIWSEVCQDCGVASCFVLFAAGSFVPTIVPDAFNIVCVVLDKTWMHTPEALAKHYIPYNAKVCWFLKMIIPLQLRCDQKKRRGFILFSEMEARMCLD